MTKTVSWVLGVILVVLGVWGFFTGGADVLGFLASNTLSNIIHVVIGVIVIAMAAKPSAGATLKTVGIIYAILGLLGILGWNFIPAASATDWFYLVVGIIVAVIGFTSKEGAGSMGSTTPAPQM